MLGEELEGIVSETDALKHQLFQAQKLSSVGAIASSVAHEFNNVLTTIINYTKMAQRTDNEENRKQALEKILKGGQRAAVIVSSMLGYARKGSLKKESTDLVAVSLENNLFRNEDDSLLFRPGGHGALIENLNDLDSDIIFIKNIDNVVPESWISTLALILVIAHEQPLCAAFTLVHANVFTPPMLTCEWSLVAHTLGYEVLKR